MDVAKALMGTLMVVCMVLPLGAEEIVPVGKVLKTKGDIVKIHRGWERKTIKAYRNITLYDHDAVTTGEASKAYIKLVDGSRIFLDKKSNILIRSNWEIKQKYGDVQYDIKKREKRMKLQVITDFAKINVLGTKFRLITQKEGQKVVLKEGHLNLELPEPTALHVEDERCGERYVSEVSAVDIKGGESLTFRGGKIYKECGVSHIPIAEPERVMDAITLLYRPFKGMHQCGALSETFVHAKSQPEIVGMDEGCVLSVEADYRECRVINDINRIETPYEKKGDLFRYKLLPKDKTQEASVQYQCQK